MACLMLQLDRRNVLGVVDRWANTKHKMDEGESEGECANANDDDDDKRILQISKYPFN